MEQTRRANLVRLFPPLPCEEILFLTTGHRILPEALIGQRLIKDVYERFPRKEWVQVLHSPGDASAAQLPLLPAS